MASDSHLSREQIVLLLDGELDPAETVAAEQHLLICEQCRALHDSAINLFEDVKVMDDALNAKIHAEQRAILRTRMAKDKRGLAQRMRWLAPVGFTIAATMLLGVGIKLATSKPRQLPDTYVEDRPVPNPALTPGAAREVRLADICPADDTDLDPAVPAATQQLIFSEYHVPESTRGRDFQVDYLISPQFGGTDEIKNLWPQPYTSTWNAQAKDALENRLLDMVCSGKMSLKQAQQELASDWIEAYKRAFHTETPLRNNNGIANNTGF